MDISPSLLWFRLDLRLADNPALQAAIQRGGAVIPVARSPGQTSGGVPRASFKSRIWLLSVFTKDPAFIAFSLGRDLG